MVKELLDEEALGLLNEEALGLNAASASPSEA
jgi:hypothetical protein